MRLTSLVVWKSWVSNPLRTALTILGVAVGVAVVTAIHIMDHNTIQSQLRQLRPDFGRVDFELVPKDRGADPVVIRSELQSTEGIKDVGLFHRAMVTTQGPNGATEFLEFIGLSPLPSDAFSHFVVSQGEQPNDLDRDGAVLVPEDLALHLGLEIGATFTIQPPVIPPRALCKGGVLVRSERDASKRPDPIEVRVKGLLARHGLARSNHGNVVVGSFAVARDMAPGGHSLFQVNRDYGADADRLRTELAADFQVLDENSALLGEAMDERAFRNGVKILGCLALVLGMFVVFQTLSQLLVERLRQIGLLRCLGASRRAVVSIFLLDAVAMATLGVVIGLGLGIGLAYLLQSMQFTTLGVGKVVSTFELPVVPMVWTAALGLVFTLAGAAFPLYKARNLPALRVLNARGLDAESGADVLRGVNVFLFVLLVLLLPGAYLAMTPLLGEGEKETRAVLTQLAGLMLGFGAVLLLSPKLIRIAGNLALAPWYRRVPLPTFLVQRSIERNSGRFAASVCGLAIVLLAMVALASITGALAGEIREFGARTTSGRLFIGTSKPASAATVARLGELPGVRRVEVHEGTRQVPFLLSGVAANELTRAGGLLESEPELAQSYRDERSCVISRRFAALHRIGSGSALGVLTDEGRKLYTVLAVSDDIGFWIEERAWVVADPEWLRRDFCVGAECVQQATLELEEGVPSAAVLSGVKAAAPAFDRLRLGDDIVAYHLRDLHRDFMLFDVLLVLILGLAVIGLINQMTIAAMARVREVGVLRALGMSTRQLRQSFLIESLVVSLLAAALAIVLGIPIGWVVVRGLNTVTGLEAPFVVPWTSFLVVGGVALGVGLVSAVLPGSRAARMSPAESVRYE